AAGGGAEPRSGRGGALGDRAARTRADAPARAVAVHLPRRQRPRHPARVRHAHLTRRPRAAAEPGRARGPGGDDRRRGGVVSEERVKTRVAMIVLLVIAVLASLVNY